MTVQNEITGEALGEKLLQAVQEMQSGTGTHTGARRTKAVSNEVAQARLNTGLTQKQFALALGISARTLQEWEQGRRKPSGAAKALINIAMRHPDVIAEEFERNQ